MSESKRMPYLTRAELNEEQRQLYEAITSGRRGQGGQSGESGRLRLEVSKEGGLIGPFNAWLRSPKIGHAAQQLGEALRFGSSLPNHLLEIAILVTAREWRARFEWWAHARLAQHAGVDPAIIESIRLGEVPAFSDPDQELVYRVSRELLATREVSEALYERAIERLGENGVVELVNLLGYYGMVSMTLNVFEVPLPPGEPDPFPPA